MIHYETYVSNPEFSGLNLQKKKKHSVRIFLYKEKKMKNKVCNETNITKLTFPFLFSELNLQKKRRNVQLEHFYIKKKNEK